MNTKRACRLKAKPTIDSVFVLTAREVIRETQKDASFGLAKIEIQLDRDRRVKTVNIKAYSMKTPTIDLSGFKDTVVKMLEEIRTWIACMRLPF